MRKIPLLIAGACIYFGTSAQNVNYEVEITQLKADDTGCTSDGFGLDEEVTWHVWAKDNGNQTTYTNESGGDCYAKDGNVPIVVLPGDARLPNPALLSENNTPATTITIQLEGWEDDNFNNAYGDPDRCTFDSGDDCHATATLDINFRNASACAFKTYTVDAGDFHVTVKVRWEYTQFSAGADLNGCGTIAQLNGLGNGQWTVSVGSGGSFLDDLDPATEFYGTEGGTYTLHYERLAGCITNTGYDEVIVTMLPKPSPQLTPSSAVCEGQDITFTAQNGVTYDWALGSLANVVATTTAGTYTFTALTTADLPVLVKVTDVNGCTNAESIAPILNDNPIVDLGPDSTICPGTGLTLNGLDQNPSPGYNFTTYSWNVGGSNAVIVASAAGQYICTISTEDQCTDSDTVNVSLHSAPSVDLGGDRTMCIGDTIIFDAGTGFTSYTWSSGSTTQIDTVFAFGDVYVSVTDANNCTGTSLITIGPEYNYTSLAADTTIFLGASIDLTAPAGVGYTWSNGDTTQNITVSPTINTNYEVTVLQDDQCYTVADIDVLIGKGNNLFIPTMFSPNGDDNNDRFMIYGSGISTLTLRIFNRWGDLVYENSDVTDIQANGWDGQYNGVDQPTGTYLWTLEGTDVNDIPIDFQGKNTGTILLRR